MIIKHSKIEIDKVINPEDEKDDAVKVCKVDDDKTRELLVQSRNKKLENVKDAN